VEKLADIVKGFKIGEATKSNVAKKAHNRGLNAKAVDAGIAGSDILREADCHLYEPLDLRIGKCRLVVAAPEGKELRDLISHLDGGTNLLISKGVIRKSNVFLKILEFLSLQNIFTKRPPDLSKEGLYFESLGGHGDIEKGVVRTENAQMKSPILNAVAAGSADLAQGLADFDLGVQPLGTIDTVVSNIPVLGHILTGENKSLITYYFEVKGPLLNPQVEAVPFKALGNGVAGILKRLFLSPVKLFDDISEGIRKLPAPEDGQSPASQHTGF
jgi:hypothetical protein